MRLAYSAQEGLFHGVRIIRYLTLSLSALAITALSAVSALAQAGTEMPEPSASVLLGMGLAGLLIGRRIARNKSDD